MRAGYYLHSYEMARYKPGDFAQSIVVPIDAEYLADVSFWQKHMNWGEYRKHARAAIIRAGQGNWKDEEFDYNYTEARNNGIVLGAYHFFDGRYSPQAQAEMLLKALKPLDMELYVDWEINYGGKYEGLKNVVELLRVLKANGVATGIYTGYYFFIENTPNDHALYPEVENLPLWIAWYASSTLVKVPPPWKTWRFWQMGTFPVLWGQPTKEIDMDAFNGTKNEFANQYLGAKMYVTGTVNASAGLNVRKSPSLTAEILGKLSFGTPVAGYLDAGWIQGIFNGLNGFVAAEWVSYQEATPPTGLPSYYDVTLETSDPASGLPVLYKGTANRQ